MSSRKALLPEGSITENEPKTLSALEKMKSIKYRDGFKVSADTKNMEYEMRSGSKERNRSPNRQEIKPSFKKSGTKPQFEYIESDLPNDIEKIIQKKGYK